MKHPVKAILYGLAVWLIPFAVAFFIFPLQRALFESIMAVVIAISVVVFANLYFRKVKTGFVNEGVQLGIVWFVVSFLLDMLMFSWGPMKMAFAEYVADIGVTYLMIPAITIGFGYVKK